MNKENIYFSNTDIYCTGDTTKREVRFSRSSACGYVCSVKLKDIDWLISRLQECKDRFTEVLDIEEYYKLYFEDMSTEQLVSIYNGINAGNKFIPTTEEFLDNYFKIKESTHLTEVLDRLGNYDGCLSTIYDILDSDWVTIEKDTGSIEYLEPWYKHEGNTDRHLIDSIVNEIQDYTEEELDKFNKEFGLDIKHYNTYVKEEKAQIEHEQ